MSYDDAVNNIDIDMLNNQERRESRKTSVKSREARESEKNKMSDVKNDELVIADDTIQKPPVDNRPIQEQ